MWTRIGKVILALMIGILYSSLGLAEDVSFEATVNANKISLQDMVELTLSVHGAKGDVPNISLPPIEGFDAHFVGPATKFTIINGVSSSEHAFIYDLFPSKVGHYQIPSISATIDGKIYQTSPISIEVVDKSSTSPDQATESLSDKVFMKASIEPKEVYVGQKTPLIIKVFVKDLSLQLAAAPSLTPDGFVADTTANMQKGKEVINGVSYDSLTFETSIYPTRTGHVEVGPLSAQGELVYRMRKSDDILGDLFTDTQTRPITLHAPAISLNVLPLPEEGKPKDFSGAVGQYDFKATVGPSSVKVGDPITLHMNITGQGHFKDLSVPIFNDSRFKTYDPQIKTDENSKTIEQVLIPTTSKITEVPAVSFNYFDPQEKTYKTITQGPFPVKVIAPSSEDEFKAYGFMDKTKSVPDKLLSSKSSAFDEGIKNLEKMIKSIYFWFFVLVIGILWFIFHMWREFQDKIKNDEAFARGWEADSKVKDLLKATQESLNGKNAKEFYRNLYKTINDYLADKMHVPLASLHWPKVESYLKEHSAESSYIETIKALFDRCELVRFASVPASQEQMSQDFERLQESISYLTKILN